MKKIIKISCVILVVLMIFSLTACGNKEAVADNETQISNTENNNVEKEEFSEIILTLDDEKNMNLSLTIPNKYKEITLFKKSNDGKTIYITDKESNTIVLKILISDKKDDNAIASKKTDSYVFNIFKGEEINDTYDVGKILKKMQDDAKTIIETVKITTSTSTNNQNKDETNNNSSEEITESNTEKAPKQIEEEKNTKVEVEEKENGTKVYKYTDKDGNVQEIVENPDPMDQFKEENKKPVLINP